MKLYTTELKAIDPRVGELKSWSGPTVPGISFEDARWYCDNHELSYCVVTGELVCEIGTKIENGYLVPDFDNIIDCDQNVNN